MGSNNPYDPYDALDPWEDEADESGAFAFVEDEYDSMGEMSDGFDYVEDPYDPARPVGSTREFPKTMVRQMPGGSVRADAPQQPKGVLRRKHRRSRLEAHNAQAEGRAYRADQDELSHAAPAPAPAPRQRRAPRRGGRRHLGCLVPLLVMIAVIVGLYWLFARPIDEKLAFSPTEQQTVDGTLSWSVPGMPYYVLALGSDAREGDAYSRTDTMLLIRIDPVGGKITMLSIPRDTKVEIEGYGVSKINAAYAYGGAGGAVRAVSKLTGASINHVAVVHFEELVGLVDYLGGVTVNVPVAVNDSYTGLNIDAGVQTMDGATALAWARTRYGYALGDYQRQEDQRILLTAIVNRMLSLSPQEIPGALEQVGNLVGTDMRCYDLVPLFLRFKLASPTIYTGAIPTTSAYLDNLWFEVVDDAKLAQVMQVVNAGGDPSTVE